MFFLILIPIIAYIRITLNTPLMCFRVCLVVYPYLYIFQFSFAIFQVPIVNFHTVVTACDRYKGQHISCRQNCVQKHASGSYFNHVMFFKWVILEKYSFESVVCTCCCDATDAERAQQIVCAVDANPFTCTVRKVKVHKNIRKKN